MKIVVSRSNKIGSWLIRCATWSRFSHVGILTDDGKHVIEALMFDGVVKTPIKEFLDRNSVVELREMQGNPIDAEQYIGCGYDWTALVGILVHRDWGKPLKWFCSEVTAIVSKLFDVKFTGRITPQHIIMVSHFLKRIKG